MDQLVFKHSELSGLPEVARRILDEFPEDRVFALFGNLGAGKTTLIKVFCDLLGVDDKATSPSFAIVNEYHCANDELVYHFDLYRIKKLEEVLDIGYEEYLYSGWYCFLEWADKMEELLPPDYIKVVIEKNERDDGRKILAVKIKTSNY